jgi:hypothetical protein
VAERRDVALLLQFEAHLIDAARGIDREHQRKVDGLPGRALRGGGVDQGRKEQQRKNAPDQAATRCIAAPA